MANLKEKRTNALYSVDISICVKGYKRIQLKGIFVAKANRCSYEKIREQCWNFVAPQIPFSENGIVPEQVSRKVKIDRISTDFIYHEE